MKQAHIEDCCIGDSIERQPGDTLPFVVERTALSYQPLPSQLKAWGRSSAAMKFIPNKEGDLQRYA